MVEPLGAPEDLTIPRDGSTTVRGLLSRGLRRLLVDLGRIDVRLAPVEARKAYARLLVAIRERMASDPGAVWSALRRPTIGTLIRYARFAGRAGEVLAELVARLSAELERAEHDGSRVVITEWLSLVRVDNNPLAAIEAHPDKHGNAVDLGGRTVETWVAALREALAIVEAYMPALVAEMVAVLQQVVPVGFDEHRHLSASYQEAIGTVYLSLHPNPMTMVEALIHEFSHNKLNLLFELDAVLENAWTPLYPSPVRPDPRPLHGVLLAVHAFTPVAWLYAAMIAAGDPRARDPGFERRMRDIVAGNHEGAAVLREHARPTVVGAGVLAEIDRWDRHFAQVIA